MEVFVARLNELIKENGISHDKLAQDLSVNMQTVNLWTQGAKYPKASYLYKLAVYFDVSADYLLGLEN